MVKRQPDKIEVSRTPCLTAIENLYRNRLASLLRSRPMSHLTFRALCAAFAQLVFSAFCSFAFGQQTIINLPSADQTPKGQAFVLHESQIRTWDPSYYVTTNFFTFGITDRVELCLTQYQFGVPSQAYGAVGVGYKATQQIFADRFPQWQFKITVGQMLPVSTTGKGVGLWTYGFPSLRLPVTRTRLAVGMGYGPRQNFGVNVWHATASIEQPIAAHWNVLAEWFSGSNHQNAYVVPGINYHSDSGWIFILGYKISNKRGTESDGVVVELGRFFL